MTDDSFKLADTLWTKGASAREGALVLFQEAQARAKHETKPEHKVSQYVHSGPLSTPIYLLTGTAFELLLKAGVILAGGKASNSYLRNTIGHNLETALRECRAAGFSPDIEKLDFAISYLSQPYRRHFFRYTSPSTFDVPDMQVSLTAAKKLERELVSALPGHRPY